MTDIFGIKVSKVGKGISSTTPEDFILNSEYGSVKIYKQNANEAYLTAIVPANSYVDVSITHSLGFAPMTMLYTEPTPGSGRWYFGCPYYNLTTEETYVSNNGNYTYVDDTYFKFRIYNNTAVEKTVKYYYFIMGNTAQ